MGIEQKTAILHLQPSPNRRFDVGQRDLEVEQILGLRLWCDTTCLQRRLATVLIQEFDNLFLNRNQSFFSALGAKTVDALIS